MPRRVSRFVPDFAIGWLERIICQDELNAMLRAGYPARGSEFARRILNHLGISVEINGLDNLPDGRFMFASNHPLGALDGIALIAVLGEKYGDDGVRFLVNDLLMNVEPLRDVFLPINKFGSQSRNAAKSIAEELNSGKQIVQFPAGLVSRLHPDGKIRDLEWKKSFVAKAIETDRDIVPIFFDGLNSMTFYKTAKWRKKLKIKVNLEQALLPSEICKSRGKSFRIIFGNPILAGDLRAENATSSELAERLKSLAYSLPNK